MSWWQRLWWRKQMDEQLDRELRFHLKQHTAELIEQGYAPDEAKRQARIDLGGPQQVTEKCRDARGTRWLEDLWQDLRYALRALRRNPAFTAVAVSCLALGIGVNSAIFSLTMEALFARPSVRDAQSVVYVQIGGSDTTSVAVWRVLHDQGGYQELAGVQEMAEANWRVGDQTRHLSAARVTDNFFATLGVPVLVGHPIQIGDRAAAVISYGLWQRWFSTDRNVMGKTLVLDGQTYTITGVLPRDHRSLTGIGISPDIYLPATTETEQVGLYARVPQGLNREAVRSRLAPLCRELDKLLPLPRRTWEQSIRVNGVLGLDRLDAQGLLPAAGFFAVLMVVVGLVLLIACTNVASLLLARASSRRQEFAIRTALGASRGRIVRQLMAETSLLAMLGAAGGLMLNLLLTQVMNNITLPVSLPIRLLIQPNWRLLAYLVLVAVLSTLVAGLMPALKTAKGAIQFVLKEHEGQVGKARWNLRTALVVLQLAVSALLLLTGALFARNLMKAGTTDLGFNVNDTLWTHARLVPGKYPTVEQIEQLTDSALERILRVPGVVAATAVRVVPMNDVGSYEGDLDIHTDISDQPVSPVTSLDVNWVGADYFRTMDIPIVQGRPFLPTERQHTPEVGILNEEMARRVFGDQSPIGHTISVGAMNTHFPWEALDHPVAHPILIVGVARNSKYWTLGEGKMSALYVAYAQANFSGVPRVPTDIHFLVRASSQPASLITPLNDTLGAVDPTAFIETKTMRSSLAFALLPSRAGAIITGSIGTLGVALAAIGLYGLLLYAVSRRTKEIGLRIALGAKRSDIIRLVLGESLVLCGLGLSIGLGIAVFAARPLAMFLVPGLSPNDPTSFGVVIGVMLAITLAATSPPVLRALRIDPIAALRNDGGAQ